VLKASSAEAGLTSRTTSGNCAAELSVEARLGGTARACSRMSGAEIVRATASAWEDEIDVCGDRSRGGIGPIVDNHSARTG